MLSAKIDRRLKQGAIVDGRSNTSCKRAFLDTAFNTGFVVSGNFRRLKNAEQGSFEQRKLIGGKVALLAARFTNLQQKRINQGRQGTNRFGGTEMHTA